MAGTANDDADELIAGINVTPLVDVVLVLLVVLMTTASYLASQSIPVDLPKAATGEATNTLLGVSLTREGRLFLEGKPVSDAGFRAQVQRAHAADAEVRAVIAADGGVPHRLVVHVIDLLRREHVSKFALDVDVEPETEAPSR